MRMMRPPYFERSFQAFGGIESSDFARKRVKARDTRRRIEITAAYSGISKVCFRSLDDCQRVCDVERGNAYDECRTEKGDLMAIWMLGRSICSSRSWRAFYLVLKCLRPVGRS
jgi:hypothetical protein